MWRKSAPFLLGAGLLLLGGCGEQTTTGQVVAGGNADSGELLIGFYDCGSCHEIPGVTGARGVIGPPLSDFGQRGFIAGSLANGPDNLIAWIVDPQSIAPATAMPDLGVTETEARDIAAYLLAL